MNKHNRFAGFTIVELLTVMLVIAILAAISVVGYSLIQRQSNDSKRQSDITAFQHQLEKFYEDNGEYPPGCITTNPCRIVDPADDSVFNTTSQQINTSMTLAQLRSLFPGLDESFGDPLNRNNPPITNYRNEPFGYIYYGGFVNNTTSTRTYKVSVNNPADGYVVHRGIFNCNVNLTLRPGQVSTYLVGYYNEQDRKNNRGQWYLRQGARGVKFSIPGNGDCQGVSPSIVMEDGSL